MRRKCPYCGSFFIPNRMVERTGTKQIFCSKYCWRKVYRHRPNYKSKQRIWARRSYRRHRKERIRAVAEYKSGHPNSVVEWSKKARMKIMTESREYLGGRCQLCGSTNNLQFCHIIYAQKFKRDTLAAARDVIQHPERYLLLCKECHIHPEKYLKELIDMRAERLEMRLVTL